MFCTACGSQIGSGAFCASCGAKVESGLIISDALPASAFAQEGVNSTLDKGTYSNDNGSSYPQSHSKFESFSKGSNLFLILSKVSSLMFAAGILLYAFRVLALFGPSIAEKVDILLGDYNLSVTLSATGLAVASLISIIIVMPTWIRWLLIGLSGALFWGFVLPIRDVIEGYEFTIYSPIQILFEGWNWWSDGSYDATRVWLVATFWVLGLLGAQIAPTLATIAFLGETIRNKKLS